jgi:hypothetical protein
MLKCGKTQPFFNEDFISNIVQILFQITVSLNLWEFIHFSLRELTHFK